jgi:predicted GTPase
MQAGIGDILDEIYNYFPKKTEEENDDEKVKVALIRKAKCAENLH